MHPLEFVYAKHLAKLPPGVLLLSEFTGFSRVLNGCLRVNPNSQVEMVEMLDTALQMDPVEREARAAKDVTHIGRCTLEAFAYRFIAELKSTATKREEDFVCVGFGLSKFRLVGMGAGFKPLDTSDTVDRFQRASRRAVLLDWGGTIAPASSAGFYDQRASTGFSLPQNVLDALAALCADPNCHVMILSGLPKAKVLSAFSSVPNLSLAVEHGFNYRIGNSDEWQNLVDAVDDGWRSVAKSVMNVYATRTHGAFVQTKGSSMLFNFQDSDPEFGYMQGKELQATLAQVLADFPVVVRTGKGYVEACLKEVNKGAMAKRFVQTLEADGNGKLDFILCAGDDSTDELMFAALNESVGKNDEKLFTVTVGRKPSEASRYLDSHREVVELLELLSSVGFRAPGAKLDSSSGSLGLGGGGGGMGKKQGGVGGGLGRGSFTNLASLA